MIELPSPDRLVDYYLGFQREPWDPPRTHWRASGIGGCLQAQTLRRLGVGASRELDAKTLRTFALGNVIHEWVQGIYADLGVLVAAEVEMADPRLLVVGHADIVARVIPEVVTDNDSLVHHALRLGLHRELAIDTVDQWYGVELKTANARAMEFRFKDGPQEEHKVQAAIYKHLASVTPGYQGVQRWFLNYIGKDWGGMLTYEVEDEWVTNALERVVALNTAWNSGLLPPCECPSQYKGKGPDYCDFAEGGGMCCARDITGRNGQQALAAMERREHV